MKKQILLVEDEPTIQRLLYFLLSKDFDLRIAGNGYEAFLLLEAHRIPDLIIMDWVMPHLDGKSFLKCLKVSGFYCDIPVIVLSASENINEELNGLPYAVDKCLRKPFDPIILKQAIAETFNTNAY
ncbi:response regulator [Parapedobacter koreensis]|uniref:Two-component system, OmpR family, phosphate regulon response regulator PhoB n=1 Tax=Parapedobacter koreensis TaxID=332977 RepID=A0A1H7IM09_9SPHI|nr:response regulator [Parapedobacter koreensis]SEK62600.1 two-component system, OmpR family, phosphate regulon response regulator PhoB [Parapedobacter koreensis]